MKKLPKLGPAPRPVNGRVVIIPEPRETQLESGIVLPEDACDKPNIGVVVAVDTKRTPENAYVQIADRVLYSPYAQTVKVDDTEYVILSELSEILAIL